jgi:hypothetical protein
MRKTGGGGLSANFANFRTVEHLPSISHPLATVGSAVRGLSASAYSAWSAVKSLPPFPSVLSVKSVVKHHSAT